MMFPRITLHNKIAVVAVIMAKKEGILGKENLGAV